MNVLVIGGAGFIGNHCVEYLAAQGHSVWATIRHHSNPKPLPLHDRIVYIEVNYEQTELLASSFHTLRESGVQWDAVVYLLGATKAIHSNEFFHVNVTLLKNCIQALRQTQMLPERCIYMSSLSVMGDSTGDFMHKISPEEQPDPHTKYGKSKLLAEVWLQQQTDIKLTILRPTGVYGPAETDYLKQIKMIKQGFDILIGSEEIQYTFIYVKDLVRIINTVLLNPEVTIGKTYHVSDGIQYPQRVFRELILENLGGHFVWIIPIARWNFIFVCFLGEAVQKIVKIKTPLNRDKRNIILQKNWNCDTTALVRDLNFSPEYYLRRGMKETIEWYKQAGWI